MAAIHVTTAWDKVAGQLTVTETTQKGLGRLKAEKQEALHDMLLQSVPRNTDIFVTYPDKRLFRLRSDSPVTRLQ